MVKYTKNKIVKGCVTGTEKYGIFITLDEYYSGLIHISEISNGFVSDINSFVNIGETIKARVVECDDDTFHVKLSIKDLDYRIGKKINAYIKETESGFLTLENQLNTWIKETKIKKR